MTGIVSMGEAARVEAQRQRQFAPSAVKQRLHWSERLAQLGLVGIALLLGVGLVAPLFRILMQALEGPGGGLGLGAFGAYLASPALLTSLWNSVWVSALVTLLVVPLAFCFAYALARSCMPCK